MTVLGLETALFSPKRRIGEIVAQVTIEESHSDETIITEHPVEVGAPITDHAYLKPSDVVIKVGWSNSSFASLVNSVSNFFNSFSENEFTGTSYAREAYEQLLKLRATREPFDVVTGKRTYSNMLIRHISAVTDKQTENSFFATLVCREILITNTQTVTVTGRDVHASPQATAPVEDQGAKQAVTKAPTLLQRFSNFITGY